MWTCVQQLEKVRVAYHKSCQKENTALDKEKQANENSEMSEEKKQKIIEARERATEDKEKVRYQHETALPSELSTLHCIVTNPDSQHQTEPNN